MRRNERKLPCRLDKRISLCYTSSLSRDCVNYYTMILRCVEITGNFYVNCISTFFTLHVIIKHRLPKFDLTLSIANQLPRWIRVIMTYNVTEKYIRLDFYRRKEARKGCVSYDGD